MADRYMDPKRLVGVLEEWHYYLLFYHPSVYIVMAPLLAVFLLAVVSLAAPLFGMLFLVNPDMYGQAMATFSRMGPQDRKSPQQRDDRVNAIEHSMVENRGVEQHLDRPENRAFNSIHADHLRILNDLVRRLDEAGDPVGAAAAYEHLLANWPSAAGPIPAPFTTHATSPLTGQAGGTFRIERTQAGWPRGN